MHIEINLHVSEHYWILEIVVDFSTVEKLKFPINYAVCELHSIGNVALASKYDFG